MNQVKRDYQQLLTTEGVSQESFNQLKLELTQNVDAHNAEVAKLTAQFDEKQAEILELRGSTGSLNTKISSLVEKLANHPVPSEGDETANDLKSVVQFLENERRILDAETAGLRGKLERESINFRVLQRALDDGKCLYFNFSKGHIQVKTRSTYHMLCFFTPARAELATQKSPQNSVQSEPFPGTSVALLTESNAHLRQAKIDLNAKIKDLETKLTVAESKVAPLEGQVQEWVVKGRGFDMEIDGLKQVGFFYFH